MYMCEYSGTQISVLLPVSFNCCIAFLDTYAKSPMKGPVYVAVINVVVWRKVQPPSPVPILSIVNA